MPRTRFLVLALTLLALSPHAYKLTFSIGELYNGFVTDDAFYYYRTAFNIRDGWGSTFDTVNPTNGYHPMWMGLCTLVAVFVKQPETFVYVILALNTLCVFLLLTRLASAFGSTLGVGGVGLLAVLVTGNYVSSYATMCGLETGLYAWLAFTAVDRLARMNPLRLREHAALGVLFALAFLARTEFVLILPAYLAQATRWRRCGQNAHARATLARGIALLSLVVVAIAGPYLAWNMSLTGHPQQISGLVKSLQLSGGLSAPGAALAAIGLFARTLVLSLSPLAFHDGRAYPGVLAVPSVLVLVVIAVAAARVALRNVSPRILPAGLGPLGLLGIFSITALAYYFVHYGAGIRPWTLSIPILTVQVLAVHGVRSLWNHVAERRGVRLALGATALAYATGCVTQVGAYRAAFSETHYRFMAPGRLHAAATEWIKKNVADDETIGIWNAGYVGFFSGKRVVNLDGLINGPELYAYLADGRGVWRFIEDAGIDYVADYYHGEPAPERSPLGARLDRVYAKIPLRREAGSERLGYYVWRVREPIAASERDKRETPRSLSGGGG